ncbi:metallophosphoesterase family protein [Isobaculum melis]|uniref:DNA repair exonuclease SbcCD nuclease subunit n=1 Tax=Isobaculum melis TaxID=142588 RepID=A0A1H9QK58_9LACT|nr:DNA repair exonuclease [Isobaculum melis]SER60777.1 DNA repair exonuclease SbcCD nuclease subunit [Isobaculum melis]
MIRMLHAGDLHLDSPFTSLKYFPENLWTQVYESTFDSFHQIVQLAITQQVDVVILTGDIYDGADRSVKAQARLIRELEQLGNAQIPVVMIHGNHDHLAGEWLNLPFPENVYLLGPEVETIQLSFENGETACFTGFSYAQRAVHERMITQYPVKNAQVDYQIGLLHGNLEGSQSGHSPYAPFTIAELLEKKYDYWALGHIHQRKVLHELPAIVYSGNIQGRNKKEVGEKGCYLVELSPHDCRLVFHPTAPIIWQELSIDCAEISGIKGIYLMLSEALEKLEQEGKNKLLKVILKHVELSDPQELKALKNGELLAAFQDGQQLKQPFIWMYQLEIEEQEALSEFGTAYYQVEWEKMLKELTTEATFEQLAAPLFDHPNHLPFLEALSIEEKNEVIAHSKQLILQQLSKKKRGDLREDL